MSKTASREAILRVLRLLSGRQYDYYLFHFIIIFNCLFVNVLSIIFSANLNIFSFCADAVVQHIHKHLFIMVN